MKCDAVRLLNTVQRVREREKKIEEKKRENANIQILKFIITGIYIYRYRQRDKNCAKNDVEMLCESEDDNDHDRQFKDTE